MKYVRRTMWFIASRALLLTVIAAILVCGFYMSMNTANIYIVLTDGLKQRVNVILTAEGAEALGDYFAADFLNDDNALKGAFDGTSSYGAYNITDFDYVLTINSIWAWPWNNEAECTVLERVPAITATVLSSRRDEVSAEPAPWQGGTYKIFLERIAGKWKITGMKQTGVFVEPTRAPAEEQ